MKKDKEVASGTPTYDDVYFRGNNWFFKLLRFFNLLEPGRTVLSISKILVFIGAWILIMTCLYNPENVVAVMGAVSAFTLPMFNYIYRRYVFDKNGHYKIEGHSYGDPTQGNQFKEAFDAVKDSVTEAVTEKMSDKG